jgi:hypothetical protein
LRKHAMLNGNKRRPASSPMPAFGGSQAEAAADGAAGAAANASRRASTGDGGGGSRRQALKANGARVHDLAALLMRRMSWGTMSLAFCLFVGVCVLMIMGHGGVSVLTRHLVWWASSSASDNRFVLLVKVSSPEANLKAVLSHYASCAFPDQPKHRIVGALRVIHSPSGAWHIRDMHQALTVPVTGVLHEGSIGTSSLTTQAAADPIVAKLLNADASRHQAVFLATFEQEEADAAHLDCTELAAMFGAWHDHHPLQIVGTSPLAHVMVPEDALTLSTGWPRYRATRRRKDAPMYGRYSMMGLDRAFVDKQYIAELAEMAGAAVVEVGNEGMIMNSATRSTTSGGKTNPLAPLVGACEDQVLFNYYVSQRTGLPPIYVETGGLNARGGRGVATIRRRRQPPGSASSSTLTLEHQGDCVSRLARLRSGGKLPFVWTDAVVSTTDVLAQMAADVEAGAPTVEARRAHHDAASNKPHEAATTAAEPHPSSSPSTATLQRMMGKFRMIDSPEGLQRKFMLNNDWLVGVAVVITMETRPNEAASAVRHLHDRYPFVREAVVWNNFNLTMNHHMFPYDEVYVRYIMAPQDYGAYAKYLGCLLARYDICYFLHEKMRPSTLVGPLYNAFLMRPDAMAATVEAQAMLDVYSGLTFDLTTTTARKQEMTMHYLDILQGTMVHKDRVREFVDRLNIDEDDGEESVALAAAPTELDGDGMAAILTSMTSSSIQLKARLADLLFVYSQPTVPTFLPHAVKNNMPKGNDEFPTAADVEAAVAFAAKSRQSSPAGGGDEENHADTIVDPLSAIFTHARTPCSSGRCTFTTSINTWPTTRHRLDHQQIEDLRTGHQKKQYHKLEANQTYWAAVDGNLKTAWKASVPTSSSPWFVGLELPAPTLITGVRLWSKAEIKPTPILQLTYHGDIVYQPASPNLCKDGKWATEGKLKVLRFECVMPLRVTRVRLVIIQAAAASSSKPPSTIVELAELQVDPVSSPLLDEASRFAHELDLYDADAAKKATGALAISQYPTAPSLGGKVVYVLQEPISELLQGTALAFVEEACEMGRLYPGNVTLVYDGGDDASIGDDEQPTATSASSSSSTSMLQALADAFAVVGSTCPLVGDDGGGSALHMHALYDAAVGRRNDGSNKLIAWWTSDPSIAASTSLVVFTSSVGEATDDGNLLIAQLLRERDRLAPNAVFVARTFGHIAGIFQDAVNLADGVLVASQREYVTHAQGQNFKGQDIRLAYPLRMLSANPAILQTPTTPAVEEIVLLVTSATTEQDLAMFSSSVAPIVQPKADVRIANVTTMQLQLSRRAGLSTDERVMAPKWRTVKDVAYYVSIYPSRVLWILDATVGSAYYASIASIEGARFIASKLAIPHTQSRMLAWNATCEWTAEAFLDKAYELVNAKYNASSSFIDQERLRSDAFDLVIEEWPIKRLFAPFANTVAQVVHYAAELMAGHEMRKAHRLSDVESVLI